jgi:hypothetical protein
MLVSNPTPIESTAFVRRIEKQINWRAEALYEETNEREFDETHMMATVAGLIFLDSDFTLENIAEQLDKVQLYMVEKICTTVNESEKKRLLTKVKLLQALANEFRWQSAYGCRK